MKASLRTYSELVEEGLFYFIAFPAGAVLFVLVAPFALLGWIVRKVLPDEG